MRAENALCSNPSFASRASRWARILRVQNGPSVEQRETALAATSSRCVPVELARLGRRRRDRLRRPMALGSTSRTHRHRTGRPSGLDTPALPGSRFRVEPRLPWRLVSCLGSALETSHREQSLTPPRIACPIARRQLRPIPWRDTAFHELARAFPACRPRSSSRCTGEVRRRGCRCARPAPRW